VKSRVDGNITQVQFTEGQEVKQGDPLFQIDSRPFQAVLEQAQANLQKDQSQLQGAELDLARFPKLVEPGFQTRQSYDDQKATVGQLQGATKADQALIDSSQLNLDYANVRSPITGRTGARLVDLGNFVQKFGQGAIENRGKDALDKALQDLFKPKKDKDEESDKKSPATKKKKS